MFKIAFSNFKNYKFRFFFVSLTIIFGVGLATTTLILSSSLRLTFSQVIDSVDLESHVLVVKSADENQFLADSNEIVEISHNNDSRNIDRYFPDDQVINQLKTVDSDWIDGIIGQVHLDDWNWNSKTLRVKTSSSKEIINSNFDADYDQIFETNIISHYIDDKASYNPFILIDGRLPENSSEVVIDYKLALDHQLEIGQDLTVEILHNNQLDKSQSVQIVGFNQSKFNYVSDLLEGLGGLLDKIHYRYLIFDIQTVQQLADLKTNQYTDIYVFLDEDKLDKISSSQIHQVRRDLTAKLSQQIGDNPKVTIDQYTDHSIIYGALDTLGEALEEALKVMTYILLFFISLAMLVGIFVIVNTFNIIFVQRTKELALLRALAFSRKQIYSLATCEALIVAVVASLIGLGLGLLVVVGLVQIIDINSLNLPEVNFHLNWSDFIYPFCLGLVITLLASITPAIKASRVSVVEGLAETHQFVKQSLKIRTILGLIGLGLSILILILILLSLSSLNEDSDPFHYISRVAGLIFSLSTLAISCLILMPWLIKAGSYLLENIFKPFFKYSHLVASNLRRDAKRSATTTNTLVVGVILIVFITISIGWFEKTVTSEIESVTFNDWALVTQRSYFDSQPSTTPSISFEQYQNLEAEINKLEGITDFNKLQSSLTFGQLKHQVTSEDPTYLAVVGLNPNTINTVSNLQLTDKDIQVLNQGQILIADDGKFKSHIGQSLVLLSDRGHQTEYIIGGTFDPGDLEYGEHWSPNLLMNHSAFSRFNPNLYKIDFLMNSQASADNEGLEEDLKTLADKYPNLRLSSLSLLISQVRTALNVTLNVLRGLFGLSVVVAFIGIFNTLSLSILERFREIGILRASGMTKRQVKAMVNFEAVMIVLIGATVGFILGLIFAGLTFHILKTMVSATSGAASDEVTWLFTIPWQDIVFYYLIAVIVAFIASFWPARKAANLDIVKAISQIN
ncbi:MAG: FtsX-like permease family protein [Candidatus Saccharibacteria bacterium]|nr:FtsX-like permease family protein [Candidatus Saccharibacteria bacterium]